MEASSGVDADRPFRGSGATRVTGRTRNRRQQRLNGGQFGTKAVDAFFNWWVGCGQTSEAAFHDEDDQRPPSSSDP